MRYVYLNGKYLPPDEALISPFDRGFIFGDGIYEVIPVYGGRPFRVAQHWQRLENSLKAIDLKNPLELPEWNRLLERLIRDNGGGELSIYLQVTRGVAPRDHAYPVDTAPTVFAYAQPLKYPEQNLIQEGIAAITLPDIRWLRCDIKATALLANVLLRQQAVARGAAEAILVRDGFVTEGAASNIFVVSHGRLFTPPKGAFILPGVTREVVLELAAANGVPCKEEPISEAQFRSAEEVWMTSSTREILAITRINDKPVGPGRPGPLYRRLYALYQEYKEAFRTGQAA